MKICIKIALILIISPNFSIFSMEHVYKKQKCENLDYLEEKKISNLETLPIELTNLILAQVLYSYLKDLIQSLGQEDIVFNSIEIDLGKIFNKSTNNLRSVCKSFKAIIDSDFFRQEIVKYKENLIKYKFRFYIEYIESLNLDAEAKNQYLIKYLEYDKDRTTDNASIITTIKNITDDLISAHVLVLLGANPNFKFRSSYQDKYINDFTYLMQIAHFNALGLAKLIVYKGAEIDAKDSDGNTALFFATAQNSEKIAKFLVKSGANINVQPIGSGKYTPLMNTAVNGNVKLVKFLLKHGADANLKNEENKTALDLIEPYAHNFGAGKPYVQIFKYLKFSKDLTS